MIRAAGETLIIDDSNAYANYRFNRGSTQLRWIIVHDPGNDRASAGAILRYLQRAQFTYNEFVFQNGSVYPSVLPRQIVSAQLSPLHQYTWHAGAYTRIPNTSVYNGWVNPSTWGVSVLTYGQPQPQSMYNALADLIAHRIKELGLPDAGVVLSHREVSTVRGRRTDPRGIDMNRLRASIAARL